MRGQYLFHAAMVLFTPILKIVTCAVLRSFHHKSCQFVMWCKDDRIIGLQFLENDPNILIYLWWLWMGIKYPKMKPSYSLPLIGGLLHHLSQFGGSCWRPLKSIFVYAAEGIKKNMCVVHMKWGMVFARLKWHLHYLLLILYLLVYIPVSSPAFSFFHYPFHWSHHIAKLNASSAVVWQNLFMQLV